MTAEEIATETGACAALALRQLRARFDWARAELADRTPDDMRQWFTDVGWSRGPTPSGVLVFSRSERDAVTSRSAVVATRYVEVTLLGGGRCAVTAHRG